MKTFILTLLSIFVVTSLRAQPVTTLLGSSPRDKMIAQFWAQNNNASNTMAGLNQYSNVRLIDGLLPLTITGKTLSGIFKGTNGFAFEGTGDTVVAKARSANDPVWFSILNAAQQRRAYWGYPDTNSSAMTINNTEAGGTHFIDGGGIFIDEMLSFANGSNRYPVITIPRGFISIKDVSAGAVNVMAYGARGDGVTDDTAAFQAALDTGAQSIMVPQGIYKITGTLVMRRDCQVLYGMSPRGTYLLYDPASTGTLLQVGDKTNSIFQVEIRNIAFQCVSNSIAKTAIEIWDGRSTTIDNIEVYPWDGSVTNMIALHTHGRDNNTFSRLFLTTKRPIVISTNLNDIIACDQTHFQDLALTCTDPFGANVYIDRDLYLSQTTFDGRESWNLGLFGLYWKNTNAVLRSNGLRISNLRTEQGTATNGWSVWIEQGQSMKSGAGNLLENFTMDGNTFLDGFRNGVYLRGVSASTFNSVGFYQTTSGAPVQLDADDSNDHVMLLSVFSQQNGIANLSGLINVWSAPSAIGGTPLPETALFLRTTGNTPATAYNLFIAQGGSVGAKVDAHQGEWWMRRTLEDSTNMAILHIDREHFQTTNDARRVGIDFGDYYSNSRLAEAGIYFGRKLASANYFADGMMLISTNGLGTFDYGNLEKAWYVDGEKRYMAYGGPQLVKDYFDGQREGTQITLQFTSEGSVFPAWLGRHHTGTTSSPISVNLPWFETDTTVGVTNFIGMMRFTRDDSSATYFSTYSQFVNTNRNNPATNISMLTEAFRISATNGEVYVPTRFLVGTGSSPFQVNNNGSITGPQTFNNLTASTVTYSDGTKSLVSIANGTGVLNNDGSGGISWGQLQVGAGLTAVSNTVGAVTTWKLTNAFTVYDGGVKIASRPAINFVPGTGIGIAASDDPANNRIQVQIENTVTASITYGFLTFPNSDFATFDSYADVTFLGTVMQTDVLSPGTYIVTAMVGAEMPHSGGEAIYVQLYNTETSAAVDGSEKFSGAVGSAASLAPFTSIATDGLVTISSSGRVKVQAHNYNIGDTDSYIVGGRCTIRWIKVN